MILAFIALLVASPAEVDVVREAKSALSRGRSVQAREMIGAAVKRGASGAAVDRLLADLSFAERRWAEASVRYQVLIDGGDRRSAVFENAAIAALEQGNSASASALLAQAERLHSVGWRVFNIRAVLADRAGQWDEADAAYARALDANPTAPELHNNLGWSLLLRGEWQRAHEQLSQAAALAPDNARITANRDLAASALMSDLPVRRAGESGYSYAARLNDAGALALLAGQTAKARAAFARALIESDRWLTRAANNLELAQLPSTPR